MTFYNKIVRQQTNYKQWQNSDEVISWFENIENKKKHLFIQFDVVNFYPSITAELMEAAINWASTYTNISESEKTTIIEAKRALIFPNGQPWIKKGTLTLM